MPPQGAVKNAHHRVHDSLLPDSTSELIKVKPTASSGTMRWTSAILTSPHNGQQNSNRSGTTNDQPAADYTLKVYASADAIKFLLTLKDCSDYDVHCPYFWTQPFISTYNFNPEVNNNLFEVTVSELTYPFAIFLPISQSFDDIDNIYPVYSAAKVEASGQKWLQDPTGTSWIMAREEVK